MDRGVFKNPDAVDAKTLKCFAKMRSQILKKAAELSYAGDVTVPNPLPVEHGLRGKFYDWGQLVALPKPEGAATGVQKLEAGSVEYEMSRHEVKVGITDEASINAQMNAQNLLTVGQAGRAFARAIDSDCFNEFLDGSNTTAGTDWDTETDVNIRKQLVTAKDEIEDIGFVANKVLMTSKQMERIGRIESISRGYNTVESYLQSIFPDADILTWRKIRYRDEHLVWHTLFDPAGKLAILDKDGFAVFSQRPLTVEFKRDVDHGVDYAYNRKFFATKVAQKEAGHLLTGLNL